MITLGKNIKYIQKNIGWKMSPNSGETSKTFRKALIGQETHPNKMSETSKNALNAKGGLNPINTLESSRKLLDGKGAQTLGKHRKH